MSLAEVENTLNDSGFLSNLEKANLINNVELPPDTVDRVTDEKDIDENNLDDNCPKDVLGCVGIYAVATDKNSSTIKLDQQTNTKPTSAKL